jgi:hypothetical protein
MLDNIEEVIPRKRLIPIQLEYDSIYNIWTISPQEVGYNKVKLKATPEMMYRALRKLRAKDSMTTPHRMKKRTYQQMIDGVRDKSHEVIYAWRSKVPLNRDEFEQLCRE